MIKSEASFPKEAFDYLAKVEIDNWWFLARNDLILWVLSRFTEKIQSFFEIGCGTGVVLQEIRRHYPKIRITGAEYFNEGLQYAKRRIPDADFFQLDATQMSDFQTREVIGAFDVLEHIQNDVLVLKNLFRAIKPGGFLVLTVPQHTWLWSVVDSQAGHFRRYSYKELKKKIEDVGLTIKFSTSFVSLILPLMWLKRRGGNKKKYNAASEFQISSQMNFFLRFMMKLEFNLIRAGIRFSVGGSRLIVCQKPFDVQ